MESEQHQMGIAAFVSITCALQHQQLVVGKRMFSKHNQMFCMISWASVTPYSEASLLSCYMCLLAGDISQWQQCIQLNLLAPMALTHAFTPAMVEKKVLV